VTEISLRFYSFAIPFCSPAPVLLPSASAWLVPETAGCDLVRYGVCGCQGGMILAPLERAALWHPQTEANQRASEEAEARANRVSSRSAPCTHRCCCRSECGLLGHHPGSSWTMTTVWLAGWLTSGLHV
jgi:hypothetical protein